MSVKGQKKSLNTEQRAAVIRETFAAITEVGFMKWKAEELSLGYEVTEADRPSYVKELERIMWPDFQKMAVNASDDRLLDTRQFWIEKANTMGLKEWQQVLSAGRGAQPWYEAIAKETSQREATRQAPRQQPKQKPGMKQTP